MIRKQQKVAVSQRALVQRIGRALAVTGASLLKSRRGRGLSDYFLLDLKSGTVVVQHVNLEQFGRKLGVLEDFEEVA